MSNETIREQVARSRAAGAAAAAAEEAKGAGAEVPNNLFDAPEEVPGRARLATKVKQLSATLFEFDCEVALRRNPARAATPITSQGGQFARAGGAPVQTALNVRLPNGNWAVISITPAQLTSLTKAAMVGKEYFPAIHLVAQAQYLGQARRPDSQGNPQLEFRLMDGFKAEPILPDTSGVAQLLGLGL